MNARRKNETQKAEQSLLCRTRNGWHGVRGRRWALLLVLSGLCGMITGCLSFLKPAHSTARQFVLTPVAAAEPVTSSPSPIKLGVGQVKLPPYLFDTSLAVRKDTNEIDYLPTVLWAERLNHGLQRVLAVNLARLVPAEQVRVSTWRNEDISAEIHVAIQQFDVDKQGRGVLVAWWRIASPGGERTFKAAETRCALEGPSPDENPSGAIATLNNLVAEFSRELARAVREIVPPPRETQAST